MKILIREETPEDIIPIREVTIAAFEKLDISNQTEHLIVEALRAAEALVLSLVAETGGRVVGHIAFSPLTLSDASGGWYGLGPVSVLPEHQKKGIGKKLVETGLEKLKEQGAQGCCLVGHPEYYRKFGFENPKSLFLEGVPSEVFFALSFSGTVPEARVNFHPAFLTVREQARQS